MKCPLWYLEILKYFGNDNKYDIYLLNTTFRKLNALSENPENIYMLLESAWYISTNGTRDEITPKCVNAIN